MFSHLACAGSLIPQASRFNAIDDMDWAFGNMGIRDKARHICTLFLEDLCDFIVENIDSHFGFSRYAERISSSAYTFDPVYEELFVEDTLVIDAQNKILDEYIKKQCPTLVAISVPFPGNLFSALKCGQYIKSAYPHIKIVLGGGYVNTELRSICDARIFEFVDFITLDDGEIPLLNIVENLEGARSQSGLKRTFVKVGEKIEYIENSDSQEFSYKENVAPCYSGLKIDDYISVIDVINPMHRLWSDGFWNKLTMAHGCYWAKCTFCDTSLDYIKRFDPVSAQVLCDKVEALIEQTGKTGFHFIDEAAPPALMIAFAKEVIRRGLIISWWTNIRFDKTFTYDVCRLLRASGCIAVSGGLEVASQRILKLINKGVSVESVAEACHNLTSTGILTHAYLMYGFPTQTAQETIDSLEVVRQLFENNILHSGFWHRFAMTVHSPVGQNPEKYNVKCKKTGLNPFANNDIEHVDVKGAQHELFSEGLKKSLYNYMHDVGFDLPLQQWFNFKIPPTTIAPEYIYSSLNSVEEEVLKENAKIIWLGRMPEISYYSKKKKGKDVQMAEITINTKDAGLKLNVNRRVGDWVMQVVQKSSVVAGKELTLKQLKESFLDENLGDFLIYCESNNFNQLREAGLLIL